MAQKWAMPLAGAAAQPCSALASAPALTSSLAAVGGVQAS